VLRQRDAAAAPARLIAGGVPTEPLVAQVLVAKYADHCPLYRQSQLLAHQPPQRPDFGCRIADPGGQGRAVDHDALARQNLRLAVQWAVIGVFRYQHLGDQRLGRQTARDQPGRCCGLHHPFLAGTAGIFRPAGDEHPILRRDHVEPR
jgi:hypothetical protein